MKHKHVHTRSVEIQFPDYFGHLVKQAWKHYIHSRQLLFLSIHVTLQWRQIKFANGLTFEIR